MLRELHIANLAVIEDARIDFSTGFNVFTGQTGAGKSLVIGAFEALIGLRRAADMVRPGADEARISGVFEVGDPMLAAELAAALDQPIACGDELLITRKVFASGRSSLSVNGRPATAAMMRQAAERLVDIHGQHDHQFLLKPAHQLALLDSCAGCGADAAAFASAYAQRRALRDELEQLAAGAELRRQQIDLYRFQADEIDAADPQRGEFPELAARDRVLGSIEGLQRDAGHAHAALYDAEGSVVERLQAVTHVLIELAETDEAVEGIAEQVRSATAMLQDASFDLGRYVNRLEHDPAEAGEVRDRLNVLNRVVQKHGGAGKLSTRGLAQGDDPVLAVIAKREELGRKLDALENAGEQGGRGAQRLEELDAELEKLGARLSAARRAAAQDLMPRIEAQLAELGMADAKLTVDFFRAEDTPTGMDRVELVVQTNPGQDARPLRKIASGGELSRVMLALKSVKHRVAGRARISVMVFDEIDANIGGRLGSVIGQKLRDLATDSGADTPSDAQVLCITHLPQIAAFADRHFCITKQVQGRGATRSTQTTVGALTGDARVDELAEMMAGSTASAVSREQARELLTTARGRSASDATAASTTARAKTPKKSPPRRQPAAATAVSATSSATVAKRSSAKPHTAKTRTTKTRAAKPRTKSGSAKTSATKTGATPRTPRKRAAAISNA